MMITAQADSQISVIIIFLIEKAKPKSKKKEEPSSLFQRHRVDTLLLDLRSKFPPTFYQVTVTLILEQLFILINLCLFICYSL